MAGWVDRYKEEIVYSMEILDLFLGELLRFCARTDRILIVVTSMGQTANHALREPAVQQIIVRSPAALLEGLGIDPSSCDILSEMEPEYTIRFQDAEAAKAAYAKLSGFQSANLRIYRELSSTVVTLALEADPDAEWVEVNGSTFTLDKLGLEKVSTDDAHTARHHPRGCLFIYGSESARKTKEVVSYLEFAAALCEYFQVPSRRYMRGPTFRL